MHRVPRLQAGQSPDNSKDEGKAAKLISLFKEVLRNHHEHCYSKEALKQNAQLLELNPEISTAWNYRKLAIRHLLDLEENEAARKVITENELRLVERALLVNIKSYGAWHHRKWILKLGLSSLDNEFALLRKLLKQDARNFHGWDYRRFVVKLNNVSPEKELQYATEKINENFSNYSAWHYRSTLLDLIVKGGTSKEQVLKDEYSLVNQAYYTEPDDQSAWFYNTWLLGETKVTSGAQLLGSWPATGSTLSADWEESCVIISSRNPLDKEYSFSSFGVPIMLSFSELVAGVTVKISSKPELEHLNDVCWKPVCGNLGHSKMWVSELPIKECPEAEYSIKLEVESAGAENCNIGVDFTLHVNTKFSRTEHRHLVADQMASEGDRIWPNKLSPDKRGEPKHPSEKEVDDQAQDKLLHNEDLDGILLPTEFQQKIDVPEVGSEVWQHRILKEQIQNLRELLELEENSKWTKLTLSRVLLAHSAITQRDGQYTDEVLDLLKGLIQCDPAHRDFYMSLSSGLYIDKVLRDPKSLKQLWYEAPITDVMHGESSTGWLRWNGLSLSKFDSVERLLWVQRLDLSHNNLLSVQGLEQMQLLVALDISHNRIPQVTALSSLCQNHRLKNLNISHNEIGGHPVDSSRYSFPSVLTNQIKQSSLLRRGTYWEVQAVFGLMNLRAIEIYGNIAANDPAFRTALVEALPSLEFLDGVKVR